MMTFQIVKYKGHFAAFGRFDGEGAGWFDFDNIESRLIETLRIKYPDAKIISG